MDNDLSKFDNALPRVFIAHDDGRFDLTDAERFGKLVTVICTFNYSSELYPDNADANVPKLMDTAREVLKDFKPTVDFLCLVGSPVIYTLCAFILGRKQQRVFQPIKLLRFDRKANAYYSVTL